MFSVVTTCMGLLYCIYYYRRLLFNVLACFYSECFTRLRSRAHIMGVRCLLNHVSSAVTQWVTCYIRHAYVITTAAAAAAVVVVVGGPENWRGCPKGCAVTSALPFLVHPSEPPATDSRHQKCLVVLTRFQRILGTNVPECVGLLRIWDRLCQLLH